MNNNPYIQEAYDYLREEAGQEMKYLSYKKAFEDMLFMLEETYQPAETRGEIMQVAYDVVDDWYK